VDQLASRIDNRGYLSARLSYRLWKFVGSTPTTDFRKALWYRYTGLDYSALTAQEERAERSTPQGGTVPRVPMQDADRAIAYIDRVMDRQINKARGILPFNSILLAILSFGSVHLGDAKWLVAGLLVVSSLFCFLMFPVQWAKGSEPYSSFSKELADSVETARWRSIFIEIAIWTSAAALVIAIVVIIGGETASPAGGH
jgi:hypothetical protein